jgi:hypothetical protein
VERARLRAGAQATNRGVVSVSREVLYTPHNEGLHHRGVQGRGRS